MAQPPRLQRASRTAMGGGEWICGTQRLPQTSSPAVSLLTSEVVRFAVWSSSRTSPPLTSCLPLLRRFPSGLDDLKPSPQYRCSFGRGHLFISSVQTVISRKSLGAKFPSKSLRISCSRSFKILVATKTQNVVETYKEYGSCLYHLEQ